MSSEVTRTVDVLAPAALLPHLHFHWFHLDFLGSTVGRISFSSIISFSHSFSHVLRKKKKKKWKNKPCRWGVFAGSSFGKWKIDAVFLFLFFIIYLFLFPFAPCLFLSFFLDGRRCAINFWCDHQRLFVFRGLTTGFYESRASINDKWSQCNSFPLFNRCFHIVVPLMRKFIWRIPFLNLEE